MVSTLRAYWSGVSTCSSRPPSCTSPNMPRVLTLVSTRCRSRRRPAASVCISPRPRCTCSSRSATCLKLSPRRCSSVACSFSSTVARICSSFFSLSCLDRGELVLDGDAHLAHALVVRLRQRAQLLAELLGEALQRIGLVHRRCAPSDASCASRAPSACCASALVVWRSVSAERLLRRRELGAEAVDLLVLRARHVALLREQRLLERGERLRTAPGACRPRCARPRRAARARAVRHRRAPPPAAAHALPAGPVLPAQRDPEREKKNENQERERGPFEKHARLSQPVDARPVIQRRRLRRPPGGRGAVASARAGRSRPAPPAPAPRPARRRPASRGVVDREPGDDALAEAAGADERGDRGGADVDHRRRLDRRPGCVGGRAAAATCAAPARGVRPSESAACAKPARDAVQAGVRVAHDRQQRVEEQRDERGHQADDAEQRDQEARAAPARAWSAATATAPSSAAGEPRPAPGRDAERHADRDGERERAEHEHEMLARAGGRSRARSSCVEQARARARSGGRRALLPARSCARRRRSCGRRARRPRSARSSSVSSMRPAAGRPAAPASTIGAHQQHRVVLRERSRGRPRARAARSGRSWRRWNRRR